MPPAGFEPAIPASEWPQTHALDRAVTGIGYATVIGYFQYHISYSGAISTNFSSLVRKTDNKNLLFSFGKCGVCRFGTSEILLYLLLTVKVAIVILLG
jgi:hypothetical protein